MGVDDLMQAISFSRKCLQTGAHCAACCPSTVQQDAAVRTSHDGAFHFTDTWLPGVRTAFAMPSHTVQRGAVPPCHNMLTSTIMLAEAIYRLAISQSAYSNPEFRAAATLIT